MADFPASIYSVTNPSGSDQVSVVDHAAQHGGANGEIIAIETNLGTNGGTSVLKNFTAGEFAAKQNSETMGSLTVTKGTLTGVLINGGTMGTPVISGSISGAGTTLPTQFALGISPSVVTVADPGSAGMVTINAQAGQIFSIAFGTVAGTRTLGTPNNPTDGQVISYRIQQNVNSSGTLAFSALGTLYKFSGGTVNVPALGTTASCWNYFNFRYNSAGTQWDDQGNLVEI